MTDLLTIKKVYKMFWEVFETIIVDGLETNNIQFRTKCVVHDWIVKGKKKRIVEKRLAYLWNKKYKINVR